MTHSSGNHIEPEVVKPSSVFEDWSLHSVLRESIEMEETIVYDLLRTLKRRKRTGEMGNGMEGSGTS